MSTQNPILQQAQALYDRRSLLESEALVRGILGKSPADSEALDLLGTILLYSQREPEALAIAEKRPSNEALGLALKNHFSARAAFAKKLKQSDPEGATLLKRAEAVCKTEAKVGLKLSACLIVKNEEAYLDACLTSLKGVVDEIVVVDTGSTDGTVEIAKKHGAKLGAFEWSQDFAAARNASLDLATGDWILWIDADEVLTPESKEKTWNAMMRPQYAGFGIPILNYMTDEDDAEQYIHAPVRLFQNLSGLRFSGRIHEQVTPSLEAYSLPYATIEGACLLHYGYKPSVVEERNKLERTLSILEAELKDDPENSFQWFNLANTFSMAARHAEAVDAAHKALDSAKPNDQHLRHTYQLLAENLQHQGHLDAALRMIADAEEKRLGGIQALYTRATILNTKGAFEEAMAAIQRCLESPWPLHESGDYTIFTYKRHALAAQILGSLGRFEESLPLVQHARQVAPNSEDVAWISAVIHEKLGDMDGAADLYSELIESQGYGKRSLLALANLCLQVKDLVAAAVNLEQAWKLDTGDRDIWSYWVHVLESSGDSAGLLTAYEAIGKAEIPDSGTLVNWGRALVADRQPARAIECFSEAIKRDPSDANAYFNCGDVLFGEGNYLDAAHLFEAGLRQSPEFAQGWFVLGNALAQIGSVDGAKIAYNQCLLIEPQHASATHNLAIVSEAA